jgi:uncharacterized protein (TIGR03663 family)
MRKVSLSRTCILLLLLSAALGLILRCPCLDVRPMHNDEGVNALKFGALWEHHSYKYDPDEHHGPALPYATLVFAWLTRAPDIDHFSETRLRMLTVLFGIGLICLLPLVADALDRKAAIWAALFTALSPAMVFYSRYYIHEMLLVFFTVLALAASWRYWRSRKPGWAVLAGAALGLVCATKETFILTFTAALLALFLNHVWNRALDASVAPVKTVPIKPLHLVVAAGTWFLVVALFFSSFFSNPAGLLDFVRTFQPWVSRAGGTSIHLHPWHFYLHRLLFFHVAKGPVWTEALLLVLAVIGGVAGFRRVNLGDGSASFIRFIAIYTFLLTAFYSLIAYKTPWCLLSFWHGTILLAGVGSAVLLRSIPRLVPRISLAALLLLGAAHLGWQAWMESDTAEWAADRRNPYVYAQTSPDLLNLVTDVEWLARVSPEHQDLLIQVIAPDNDYGPLPWYLRSFKRVGWWSAIPSGLSAQIFIVSPAFHFQPTAGSPLRMLGYFQLRPQVLLELWAEPSLCQAFQSSVSSHAINPE